MARPPLPRGPSAARIGQLRGSLRSARLRRGAGRMAGRAARGAGSMLMDFLLGFFDINLDNDKSKKLGLFGKALAGGISGQAGDSSTPLPVMEKPQRVSKENNPTIATISSQLDQLVRTANKIGVYTKEQQDALLNQITQARRVSKEQQLESKTPAIPILPDAGDTGNLSPLDTSVNSLIKKIDELSETVSGLAGGQGNGLLSGLLSGLSLGRGGGGRAGARMARAANLRAAPRPSTFTVRGQQYRQNAAGRWIGDRGRYASRDVAKILERRSAASAGSAVRLATATGGQSNRIANLLASGFRSAGKSAVGKSIKSAVRRVAGPIIAKSLGRTALKSIPIVGAGIGAAFAIGRLLKGDVLGAGLDLASGLGGPLTAIPALAASVARDTYAGVYGVQPEQDPDFKSRFPEVKSSVEDLIREELTGAVQPRSTPTDQEIGATETPTNPPQRPTAVSTPPPVPPGNPPAVVTGTPTSDAGTTGAGTTSTAGADASAAPQAAAGVTAAPQPVQPNPEAGQTLIQAEMQPPAAGNLTGMALNAQEIPVSSDWQQYGFTPSLGAFIPQRGNTSRGAAQGIGNIPSPVYSAPGLEDFRSTLYFDS